jgi:hypothetical protein
MPWEADMNITREDCVALCGLEEDGVAAIAEHEHLDDIAAAALAQYLLSEPDGPHRIREMIIDDFRLALKRNNRAHARELLMALRHFVAQHKQELSTGRKHMEDARQSRRWETPLRA